MCRGLVEAGHDCVTAEDGLKGADTARQGGFDVLVVDRMMPRMDGLTLVELLRREGDQTPVLFLSALGEVDDRVAGLKAGGDDYLVKPYAFPELIARVEALARRRDTGSVHTVLRVGDLEMDLIGRGVRRAGQEIDLQPREFQLLEFLMRHAGQSITRTMLLEKVWEYHFDPQTNVIDVHISRLRGKIDKGFDKAMLQTVRGAGYRLEA
jgi:two-component system OmpR family response regulator